MENLYQELPDLVFDFQSTIFELFEKTFDFQNKIASLVPVAIDSFPSFDPITKTCVLSNIPTLIDGQWVRQYVVTDKSQDEIDQYNLTAQP